MTRRFVVGSTGHAGTAWLTLVLSFLGVPTVHEGIFTLVGRRPWPPLLAGDVSLAATPFLGDLEVEDITAAFLARNPLDVVASFHRGFTFAPTCPCHEPGAHLGSPLAQWARDELDVVFGRDELVNTIRYVAGHLRAAARAGARIVRVEDLLDGPALAEAAGDLAGIPPGAVDELLAAGPLPSARLNAHGYSGRERPAVTWAHLEGSVDGVELIRWAETNGYRP